jgi:hypothetical protein
LDKIWPGREVVASLFEQEETEETEKSEALYFSAFSASPVNSYYDQIVKLLDSGLS